MEKRGEKDAGIFLSYAADLSYLSKAATGAKGLRRLPAAASL